jgi:hypothetical protein
VRLDVARSIFRRLRILRAKIANEGGDVVVGDFVRPVWGGPLGFVVSISKGWATALRVHESPGHRDIIEVRFLKVAAADPAFGPDVRGDGDA